MLGIAFPPLAPVRCSSFVAIVPSVCISGSCLEPEMDWQEFPKQIILWIDFQNKAPQTVDCKKTQLNNIVNNATNLILRCLKLNLMEICAQISACPHWSNWYFSWIIFISKEIIVQTMENIRKLQQGQKSSFFLNLTTFILFPVTSTGCQILNLLEQTRVPLCGCLSSAFISDQSGELCGEAVIRQLGREAGAVVLATHWDNIRQGLNQQTRLTLSNQAGYLQLRRAGRMKPFVGRKEKVNWAKWMKGGTFKETALQKGPGSSHSQSSCESRREYNIMNE